MVSVLEKRLEQEVKLRNTQFLLGCLLYLRFVSKTKELGLSGIEKLTFTVPTNGEKITESVLRSWIFIAHFFCYKESFCLQTEHTKDLSSFGTFLYRGYDGTRELVRKFLYENTLTEEEVIEELSSCVRNNLPEDLWEKLQLTERQFLIRKRFISIKFLTKNKRPWLPEGITVISVDEGEKEDPVH